MYTLVARRSKFAESQLTGWICVSLLTYFTLQRHLEKLNLKRAHKKKGQEVPGTIKPATRR